MSNLQQRVIKFGILVAVWVWVFDHLLLTVDTCLDGICDFTPAEILVSLILPLPFLGIPIVLEMVIYKKSLTQALSDIGLTRFRGVSIRIAIVYLMPMLALIPFIVLTLQTPLILKDNWLWLVLNAILISGLCEEMMMRGFIHRHLREEQTFWRAATLSTLLFAGYHLRFIFSAGLVFGVIAFLIAIPAGFLAAYIYEKGNNTLWGAILLHALNNSLAFVFLWSSEIEPMVLSMFMFGGIVVSSAIVFRAYHSGYAREMHRTNTSVSTDPTVVILSSKA